MADNTAKKIIDTAKIPDCVTEVRIGNTVLIASGFYKQGAKETATDKMARVLESENSMQRNFSDN